MAVSKKVIPLVIPNGGTLTPWLDLKDARLVGILMPTAWTAASLTFDWAADGGTPASPITGYPIYDNGTERSRTVAASRYLVEAIENWLGVRWIRLRSGAVGAPVAQGAARTLYVSTDTY